MQSHIGIAMPQKTLFVRNLHATDYAFTPIHKAMNVKTATDANIHISKKQVLRGDEGWVNKQEPQNRAQSMGGKLHGCGSIAAEKKRINCGGKDS